MVKNSLKMAPKCHQMTAQMSPRCKLDALLPQLGHAFASLGHAWLNLGTLLQKMQAERIHMALVIDEYGGVEGLVTIEDLLEEIVFASCLDLVS